MSMSDPIADMITRIRNAGKAKFPSCDIPGSKLKVELAKLLQKNGYIKNYKFVEDGKQGMLRIYLKYESDGTHVIYGIDRVSKCSRRVYKKCKDIKPVYNGLGIAIVSTSNGIMSDKQAVKENLGGEILCNIW